MNKASLLLGIFSVLGIFGSILPAPRESIVFVDRTSPEWSGVIQETVADFNRIMPKDGPALSYERADALRCDGDTAPIPSENFVVTVCSGDLGKRILGLTFWSSRTNGTIQVTETIRLSREEQEATACHEFVHALTHAGDKPQDPHRDSCLIRDQSEPGAIDARKLRRFYRRH